MLEIVATRERGAPSDEPANAQDQRQRDPHRPEILSPSDCWSSRPETVAFSHTLAHQIEPSASDAWMEQLGMWVSRVFRCRC
jgi:hypothetical protein